MILSVDNNRTRLVGATPDLLQQLNMELRYPTPAAKSVAGGADLPPGEEGWDGWIRMLRIPKKSPPWFPTGLLPRVQRLIDKYGQSATVTDTRERTEEGFPELVRIPLRDYQGEAVKQAVRAGRGVLDMPPRSGKTRTACEIVRQLALPTIWTAPTDRIASQTQAVVEGFFGRGFSTQLVGTKNEADVIKYPVVICTAATAVRLSQEFFDSRKVVMIDEFHHAAAKTYRKIIDKCGHVFFRFGMTGTFFRSGEDEMELHAILSNAIFKVTSTELVERGHLVPAHVAFIPVLCSRLRGVPSNTFMDGHGKYGIHENVWRNQLAAHCALTLHRMGKKVLMLVGTKKQGRLLASLLASFVPPSPSGARNKSVEFVNADVDRRRQIEILESFDESQEVKILLGTTILGEGVDLPTADALILARGEKAEVTLLQSLYRVCTAVEGKKHAVVVDFADRHNKKLLEHSMERLRVYYEEPTFSVSVLEDPENLKKWAETR